MATPEFRMLAGGPRFWGTLVAFGVLAVIGLAGALYMEVLGHWVSGMNQHVVWGTPHVFAVFLIVAASGALNVASIAGLLGNPNLTAYNASKFGVRGFSESLMKEVRDDGIYISGSVPERLMQLVEPYLIVSA